MQEAEKSNFSLFDVAGWCILCLNVCILCLNILLGVFLVFLFCLCRCFTLFYSHFIFVSIIFKVILLFFLLNNIKLKLFGILRFLFLFMKSRNYYFLNKKRFFVVVSIIKLNYFFNYSKVY